MAETCPNCDLARAFPARLGLALFAWILTLHPTAAGRVEAAYGGVYSSAAITGRRYQTIAVGCYRPLCHPVWYSLH
ncbi:hypothetical protein [Pseudomonas luteola]|uniref:hypothetical protein n=1 Tax=Pseudomonas luteola TaxID=47886 RepID=UPI000DD4A540